MTTWHWAVALPPEWWLTLASMWWGVEVRHQNPIGCQRSHKKNTHTQKTHPTVMNECVRVRNRNQLHISVCLNPSITKDYSTRQGCDQTLRRVSEQTRSGKTRKRSGKKKTKTHFQRNWNYSWQTIPVKQFSWILGRRGDWILNSWLVWIKTGRPSWFHAVLNLKPGTRLCKEATQLHVFYKLT